MKFNNRNAQTNMRAKEAFAFHLQSYVTMYKQSSPGVGLMANGDLLVFSYY